MISNQIISLLNFSVFLGLYEIINKRQKMNIWKHFFTKKIQDKKNWLKWCIYDVQRILFFVFAKACKKRDWLPTCTCT